MVQNDLELKEVLKEKFGFSSFRKGQKELIDGIMSGRDVLGIMPTSGGKSLCYQLPALLLEGLTIVISPLISLMKDQVDSLKELGIGATFINSTVSYGEQVEILKMCSERKYRILYIAPERLSSDFFINFTRNEKISFVAIDESHCISQWGHDFRPSYKEIPIFIKKLKKRPIVAAFTATATKNVINDIRETLELENPLEVVTGFDRGNLYFEVNRNIDKRDYILKYIQENIDKSGIIYCATRKEVESLYNMLNEKNHSVEMYHGGMTNIERKTSQENFIYDRVNIMIATNAFGMGIDKSNIRYVIHNNIPQNMEAYYQEAGRSGRDGENSDCILLYSPQDVIKQKFLIEQSTYDIKREDIKYKSLQYIIDYCHTSECLRKRILNYFGENHDGKCNYCSNCLDDRAFRDVTLEAQKIISCVYRMKQRFGSTMVAKVLIGSKDKRLLAANLEKLSTYGIMENYTEKEIRMMISALVAEGYINMTEGKYPLIALSDKSEKVLKGNEKVLIKEEKEIVKKEITENENLFNRLREERLSLAEKRGVPPYIIFGDDTLKEMSNLLPTKKEEFLKINGVGEVKFENYGANFSKLIEKYRKEEGITESFVDLANKTSNTIQKKSGTNLRGIKSYMISYDLFYSGEQLKNIALERNIKEDTVLDHIVRAEKEGKTVDWDEIVDKEIEEHVVEAIEEVGHEYLKPIKDILPKEISYLDIKKVLYKNYK